MAPIGHLMALFYPKIDPPSLLDNRINPLNPNPTLYAPPPPGVGASEEGMEVLFGDGQVTFNITRVPGDLLITGMVVGIIIEIIETIVNTNIEHLLRSIIGSSLQERIMVTGNITVIITIEMMI